MEQNDPIFGAVNDYCVRRRRVNTLLLGQVQQIFSLDGFTGDRAPGRRKGSQAVQEVMELEHCNHIDGDDAEGEDIDDVENDQIDGIVNFVTSL